MRRCPMGQTVKKTQKRCRSRSIPDIQLLKARAALGFVIWNIEVASGR